MSNHEDWKEVARETALPLGERGNKEPLMENDIFVEETKGRYVYKAQVAVHNPFRILGKEISKDSGMRESAYIDVTDE